MTAELTMATRLRRAVAGPIRRRLPGAARRLIAVFHWLMGFSRLGKVDFYPVDALPWAATLEANWQAIRRELDAVLADPRQVPNVQDVYGGQEQLAQDDKWKAFVLCSGLNLWHEEHCARCPQTRQLLGQVPGLTHAMFSILAPHKHIPAHEGAYGGLIDCHLGLQVPEPAERCRIRVGQEVRHWQEGRMIAFDDAHNHEVWNDTEGQRVVLLMYVIRPLPFPLAQLNLLVMRLVSRVL